MYFFFHVFTGIVLGLLIGDILHDRRWILPCILGSFLPDLVDKPLGLIIFADSIADGRIFTHTLLAAGVLALLGLVIWKWQKTPVVLGIAAGVISHQVLDLMWGDPQNWLYPFFGPFGGGYPEAQILVLTFHELRNPFEMLLGLLFCAGVLLYLERARIRRAFSRHKDAWRGLLGAAAFLLAACAGVFIWAGLKHVRLPLTGWSRPEDYLIGGIVILLAGYLAWRWRRLVLESDPLYQR